MNLSFYSAAAGASAQQGRLNTIANNLANANNHGYKTMTSTFMGLLYQNIREPEPAISELRQGSGARLEKTDIDFSGGSLAPTDYPLDFTIIGEGLFAVRNPATNEVFYTRDGSFKLSEQLDGRFYLATAAGDYVMGPDMNPIVMESENDSEVTIGVFRFAHYEGFLAVGDNYFVPDEKCGAAVVVADPEIKRSVLEASNINLAGEFATMIETQRLYQLALRMVTTSDEIENTINNLRR